VDGESSGSIRCGNCGRQLDEVLDEVERQPCPDCGSTTRQYSGTLTATVTVHPGLKFKHKDARGRLKAKGASRSKTAGASARPARESYVADQERDKWKQTVQERTRTGEWETVHSEDIPLERKGAASWLMAQVKEAAQEMGVSINRSYLTYDLDRDTFILKLGVSKTLHRIPSEWVEDAQGGDAAPVREVRLAVQEAVKDAMASAE
jgi:predicted  nucleic acid-binding Zn-ribbon protein